MGMNEREKQLAVLEGRTPDKIPFMPRLEIWYAARYLAGTLPPEYQGKRLKDIQDDLGLGATARTAVCTPSGSGASKSSNAGWD